MYMYILFIFVLVFICTEFNSTMDENGQVNSIMGNYYSPRVFKLGELYFNNKSPYIHERGSEI